MGWSAFRPTGLTHHNPNLSVKGYTLFTPAYGRGVYLINIEGKIVKHWHFDDIDVGHIKLLPNGNLLIGAQHLSAIEKKQALAADDFSDLDLHCGRLGGGYTTLREYDFDGQLLWEYDNSRIHHDYYLCENGDILLPEWVPLPKEVAAQVGGGYPKEEVPPSRPMMGDDIIRINRKGEEVARWHTWQMFDPMEDPIGALSNRSEWTHLNSLEVMPDGQFLISCQCNSRVALIDPKEHKMTWKLTEPEISKQHHATPVPGGNIQIFDNGMNRPLWLSYSQVIEVDPRTSQTVWRYKPAASEQFFTGHLSSAQRLERGNVLICEGTAGRLFEITRSGEIVWEWVSPFIGGNDEGRLYTWIYRAYRYPVSHPAFANQDFDPARYRNLNVSYGLME